MKKPFGSEIRSSGSARRARILIVSKSLEEQGGVVNFVSMLIGKFSNDTEFEHLEIGKSSSNVNYFRKVSLLFFDCIRLIKKLRRGNFTSLQLNTSLNRKALARDGTFLALANLFGHKRNIVFIHGWDESCEHRLKESPFKRLLFRHLFGRSRILIVLASRFKDALITMGFEPNKIRVFPTMFDGDLFRAARREEKAEPDTILFLSRLVREKGIFELLEAFRHLCERYGGMKLDIAGDGAESRAVSRWIESHGLNERVRLLGYLRGEEKVRAFFAADIFVLPTRHGEGCPITLLEAMAAGLAVVTTPVGGIPDIFTDGVNGILLRDNHPATIAAAIAGLMGDRELCTRIRENSQRQAWERFEARIVTREMERLYHEVAAET